MAGEPTEHHGPEQSLWIGDENSDHEIVGEPLVDRLLKTTILFRLPDAAPGQTVVGQDDPAVDVDAVQSAVDRGGSVRLLGTFDFGEDGQVLLQKDVAISGEADASSRPITTII